MSTPPAAAPAWRRPLLAFAVVIAVLLFVLPRDDVSGQAQNAKLSTVLADLAGAVPQEQGPPAAQAARAAQVPSASELPQSVQDAIRVRQLRMDADNAVQVYVLMTEVTDATLQQLKASGVTIEITDAARRRVQARIPATRLEAVAALPFVTFIRLPTYAVRRTGAVTSEGDAILGAAAVRSGLSLDGTGVKVGVISDGLKGVFATGCTTCSGVAGGPISTGDLPAATGTRNGSGVLTSSTGGIAGRSFQANNDLEGLPPPSPPCGFAGAGAEGTALLEIVHDVAPAAQLAFANADTDLAFNQAVNFLAQNNDVVLDDLGFYGDAYDGTSSVSANTAAALNNPANRIRTYVTSVGNAADEHYYGTYTDSGVDGASVTGVRNGGRLHLFQQTADTTDVLARGAQPYNLIALPTSGEVVIFLTWNDPFGGSGNNYDLYLVREPSSGQPVVVAQSIDVQSGAQDPLEIIDYVNNGATGLFRILVQNVSNRAAVRDLNLYSFQPQCAVDGPRLLVAGRHERHNYNTATRSVAGQSDAGGSPASVISVGAICSASAAAASATSGSAPDESCLDQNHATIEFFSSRGPTLDGRTKPDISAIDGVSITGAGKFPTLFFGTSAASPHVGSIAALVLQAAPCLMAGADGALDPDTARVTLRSLLVSHADPLSDPAPDNTFGAGRVNALASVQQTLPVFTGAHALTVNGNTPTGAALTAAQLGFGDPNQCPITRLFWTGGCGTAPGTTMTCPFGTTSVDVSASNNGVAFSAAETVQVTVTGFSLGASPAAATVAAGQAAVYQVSLSADGGPFTEPVTLGCVNLPPGAACIFDPPAVSPGAGSAQATLTITTTARASASAASAGGPAVWGVPPAAARTGALRAVMALGTGLMAVPLLWITFRRPEAPRRRRLMVGALAVALAAVASHAACGSGGGGTTPPSNPPPATAPAVTLSPATLTFGTHPLQSPSAPQTVSLTNSGNAALTITGIAATGDFAQTNTCGSSLAAGASCSIAVTFTPVAAGSRTGTLSITDNATGSPHTVSLSGTGQAGGGTPAGTYQVDLTGTAGTLVRTGSVTLTVQ